jgi:hypothetical protein
MNIRKPMGDVAQAIILAGGIFEGDKKWNFTRAQRLPDL